MCQLLIPESNLLTRRLFKTKSSEQFWRNVNLNSVTCSLFVQLSLFHYAATNLSAAFTMRILVAQQSVTTKQNHLNKLPVKNKTKQPSAFRICNV